MEPVLVLLALQGLLGAFDNAWHHEIKVGLPARPAARRELALHALRGALYAPVFLVFGWLELRGWPAFALLAILLIEIVVTLCDFVEEDRARVLPAAERVLHTVLAVNFGAFLALAVPQILAWAQKSIDVAIVDRGAWAWLMSVYALGALGWALRDALAARRLSVPALATWQRRQIRVRRQGRPRTVLVTGATGFIGRHLCWRLIERGEHVIALTRDKRKAADLFGPYAEAVTSLDHIHRTRRIDAVVNLAGASIAAARWTPRRKAELVESRVGTTRLLVDWMARASRRPAVLISASAVGYYGTHSGTMLTESSASGTDFPAALCRAWEREALHAQALGVRVLVLRLGLVLGAGGLLQQLLPGFRLGLGTVFGSGGQWMSWIHLDDVLELIVQNTGEEGGMQGAVNAVAAQPASNGEFARTLAQALRRRIWLRIPAWCLRLMLGEMSTLLLEGQHVLPGRLGQAGYRFRFPTLRCALEDLVRQSSTTGMRRLSHA